MKCESTAPTMATSATTATMKTTRAFHSVTAVCKLRVQCAAQRRWRARAEQRVKEGERKRERYYDEISFSDAIIRAINFNLNIIHKLVLLRCVLGPDSDMSAHQQRQVVVILLLLFLFLSHQLRFKCDHCTHSTVNSIVRFTKCTHYKLNLI